MLVATEVFFGVCFVLMGYGIDHAHEGNKALALAVAKGFLFAGPFVSTSLYELSRQRHKRVSASHTIKKSSSRYSSFSNKR